MSIFQNLRAKKKLLFWSTLGDTFKHTKINHVKLGNFQMNMFLSLKLNKSPGGYSPENGVRVCAALKGGLHITFV